MESFAYSLGGAIIGLGILIVFHEFGHFLLAKLSGVGVLTFSVGFGPKIWVKKRGETEYALSAFPLGGYVKMIGENPDEEVTEADIQKSFAHKSLLKRTAIVIAGPGFNLLLAVFLFMAVFAFYGVPVMSTLVSDVTTGSPAEKAGIVKGDRILAIDSKPVREWSELSETIKSSGGKPLVLEVQRGSEALK
jgi:regulator of sigma E protease